MKCEFPILNGDWKVFIESSRGNFTRARSWGGSGSAAQGIELFRVTSSGWGIRRLLFRV